MATLEQSIALQPDYGTAHFNLGIVFVRMSDKEKALRVHSTLKSLDTAQADQLYTFISNMR